MIKIKIKLPVSEDRKTVGQNISTFKTTSIKGYDYDSDQQKQIWNNETKKAFENIGIKIADNEDGEEAWEEIIKMITPLNTATISYPIAFGTKGEVYKLSSGRVLKLFTESYSDDVQWYDRNTKRLDTGKADVHTLNIYDYGSFFVRMPGVATKARLLYWVEMEEIKPFAETIKQSRRSRSKTMDEIRILVFLYMRRGRQNWSTFRKNIKSQIFNKLEDAKQKRVKAGETQPGDELETSIELTDQEINGILKMLMSITKSKEQIFDVHSGNFGTRPGQSEANPIFVVFDR